MKIQQLLGLSVISGILGYPLFAKSADFVVKTDCLHPIRGKEACEVKFSDSNQVVMEILWLEQDTTTKLRYSDNDEEIWDEQENKWMPVSRVGICFNNKCINASLEDFERLEQDYSSTMASQCWHPVRGQGNCTVEGVPETEGMRVHWPDGSTDHVIMPIYDDEPALVWSHADNGWVDVSIFGVCAEDICVLDLF